MNIQLKIIIRGLLKNKKYLLFSISGLFISFTFVLLLFAYLRSELTYDRFTGYENVYRVTTKVSNNGSTVKETAMSQMPLGEALKEKMPGVVAFSRILAEENLYRTDDVKLNRQKTYWVDETFPKMFDIPVVEGNAEEALSKPFTGMVSEEVAHTFFGNKSPLGKILILNEGLKMEIKGVFKKPSYKSHFDFDYLMSFKTAFVYNQFQNNWDTDAYHTYIKLDPKTNLAEFNAELSRFAKATYVNYPKKNQQVDLQLQPVASIHLRSHLQNELTANSQYSFLVIIALLGLFTLLVSLINFSGMVSSRYLSNKTSLLMNRVLGASGSILQSMSIEIFLLAAGAFVLAALFVVLFGNQIFGLTGLQVSVFPVAVLPVLSLVLLSACFLICTAISATILFNKIPKSSRTGITKGKAIDRQQSSLVVVQYSFSIFLIIFLTMAFKQIHFLKNSNPGYIKEQVLVVHTPRTLIMNPERITKGNLFINELSRNGYAGSGTVTSDLPGKPVHSELGGFLWLSPSHSPDMKLAANLVCVDQGYFETLGIKLVAGRNFEVKEEQNAGKIIMNEKAVKEMGYSDPQKAVGETIRFNNENNDNKQYTIMGVVADFHQEGLQQEIKPMAFMHSYFYLFGSCAVKLVNAQPSTIASVKQTWESVFPNDPFDYSFLNERFNQQYQSEMLFFKVCLIFGIIATLIACYGLFGISVEIIAKRTKEIGVRKVNGATVLEILGLLNSTYVKLTSIAFVVAAPAAWYFVSRWLESFAYRTELTWWIFALAGLLALGIALLTVSWQSWKAATRNPVEALRSE